MCGAFSFEVARHATRDEVANGATSQRKNLASLLQLRRYARKGRVELSADATHNGYDSNGNTGRK